MAGMLRLSVRLQGTLVQQPLTVALKEGLRQDCIISQVISRSGMAVLAGTVARQALVSSRNLVLITPLAPCHTGTPVQVPPLRPPPQTLVTHPPPYLLAPREVSRLKTLSMHPTINTLPWRHPAPASRHTALSRLATASRQMAHLRWEQAWVSITCPFSQPRATRGCLVRQAGHFPANDMHQAILSQTPKL